MQSVIAFQREIYLALSQHIQDFAAGGGWKSFLLYLPAAVAFGAAHGLTPGHGKAILATYMIGSPLGVVRGLAVSVVASFTHVFAAVAIALLALPLVSMTLGGAGKAPLLHNLSRGMLMAIGVWMLYRAIRHRRHQYATGEGPTVGFMAGIVPCPLTLFVMTFAIARGVPQAGVAFACAMMVGIALVLASVSIVAILFRKWLIRIVETKGAYLHGTVRIFEAISGIVLMLIAATEMHSG
ncbi:MAG: ABC transporter permease [Rhizobiales bacterium]|nr:ABC transporter permease [Hyphomicrobiales bacterium]